MADISSGQDHKSGKNKMADISFVPGVNLQAGKIYHGVIVDEIEGLIRVYKNGHIERPPIIPNVSCTTSKEGLTTRDVVIEKLTNLWARVYVPNNLGKLPLLVYFHGGGFCVGSAAWICYHEFLTNLAFKVGCLILSINYRLAPENRLPAAYDDAINTLMWLKQQAFNGSPDHKWWSSRCNFSSLFLAGDSAGANIAYNVIARQLTPTNPESFIKQPLCPKGTILIQPFFGGEARIHSEKNTTQPANSALTLPAYDTYWRLSLPLGANRDHPYSNPLVNGVNKLHNMQLPPMMVCISEMDLLKDRNLEFCTALAAAGKRVEAVMYKGVGHAFQILHNSRFSQTRTQEMMTHIKSFINQYSS